MPYAYADERPRLFTEQGLTLVRFVERTVVTRCQQAGAVRAQEAWRGAPASDSFQMVAALDYLVETRVLREITDPAQVVGQHRVFVLDPGGPYGGAS